MRPIDLLDRQHQVDDADERDQRAAFHHVGDAVDPGRQEAAQRLRQDDVEHALAEAEADRLAGLGLAEMDRLDGAARDLRSPAPCVNTVKATTAVTKLLIRRARAAAAARSRS